MNQEKTGTTRAAVFLAFLVFFLVATSAWTHFNRERWDTPPLPFNIDGVFYDTIGYNLSRGNGFHVDFVNREWKGRYREYNRSETFQKRYNWVMRMQDAGPTAMRSPGYPAFLAVVYRALGWRWDAARMGGVILVSLGLALLLTWCWRRLGGLPALVASGTIVVDFSIMNSAGTIASEALAILVVSAFLVVVIRAYESPTLGRWAAAGLMFGALMLTRGNWNLALLLLIGSSFLLTSSRVRQWVLPVTPVHLLVFFTVSIAVALPWWIRNCHVTEHFQPFGTAGANGLVGAYCDDSFNDYGNWQNEMYRRNKTEVVATVDVSGMSLAHREYVTGRESTKKAFAWAGDNWYRLPQLGFYRILSHWGFTNPTVPPPARIANIVLILVGWLGCLLLRGRARHVVVIILLIDTLVVMVTWAHLGRYGIPLRPLIHVGFATMVCGGYQRWFGRAPATEADSD